MNIIKSIKVWVHERNLHTAHPHTQFVKVVEEVGEIAQGLARQNKALIQDAIGDTVVTLVSLCETLDLDFNECVLGAYNEIKDRKGKLIDGVFVKESDLNE